jgi:predicted PurR-regulated permease PerM
MAFFETDRQRAGAVILLLGAALLLTLLPYASGLIGGLVLYVVFRPIFLQLARPLPERVAAAIVITVAVILILGPLAVFTGLVVDQAQNIAGGVARGPLVDRLSQLEIMGFPIGPRLAGLGEQVLAWLGRSAFGVLGTATRIGLNLTIALFILFYLLRRPEETWEAVKPYIPFSPASAELLRVRFHDVTVSTVIGTGLIALIQGMIVAFGFWLTGLSNALFWGVVTVVFAILPVVGSGVIMVPAVLTLFLGERYGAAALLAVLAVVAGNVDVVIRPLVFRRYAQIHPLVTLIGAIGGVSYFGLLGILIGPLMVSYFFELIRIYRAEYVEPGSGGPVPPTVPPAAPPAAPPALPA